MSISALKKSRMSFDDLAKKFEKDSSKKSNVDERMFYPARDDNGNGQAIIRFLPAKEGEDSAWVKTYSHGFKGPTGKWFIEECPTTIGKDCICCEKNSELWNSGIDTDKEIARSRKRRLQYISNVLVVSDKKNPEREGKVFLFKYGSKIFDKVKGAMYPEFDDETPCIVSDPWDGANFNLKIKKVKGMTNYDSSSFMESTPLADTDKGIEAIWKQEYSLEEFIAPTVYKSEDELKKNLARVLNEGTREPVAQSNTSSASEAPATPAQEQTSAPVADSTESAMDFFRKMAED